MSNDCAFVALRSDNATVTWGNSTCGGDSASVSSLLRSATIVSGNARSFLAVIDKGDTSTFVTSGDPQSGGQVPKGVDLTNGSFFYVTDEAYLMEFVSDSGESDRFVTWGNPDFGGKASKAAERMMKNSSFRIGSSSCAFTIYSTETVAPKVEAWGNPECGGDSSSVKLPEHIMVDAYGCKST